MCKQGYNGPNCAFHCRYPSYGMGCQSECKCEESECNPIAGCMHITKFYYYYHHQNINIIQRNIALRHFLSVLQLFACSHNVYNVHTVSAKDTLRSYNQHHGSKFAYVLKQSLL